MKQELVRHQTRRSEIDRMSASLVLLDQHRPAMDAAGLTLAPALFALDAKRRLRIGCALFQALNHPKLVEVLMKAGFEEMERMERVDDVDVVLSHGRLTVKVGLRSPTVGKGAPAAPKKKAT